MIHFHVHDHYSNLDGLCTSDQWAKSAKSQGMPALGLTNHGNLCGIPSFVRSCIEHDIQPLIGVEVYVAEDRTIKTKEVARKEGHLVLIARNKQGLENLFHIVSDSYITGFYYRPRTDISVLSEYGSGIIATSACHASILLREWDKTGKIGACNLARLLSGYFDHFYLEIQPHNTEEQIIANGRLRTIHLKTNIPLIAANDCHYPSKKYSKLHDVLLLVQTRKTLQDIEDGKKVMHFDGGDFYMKSADEMLDGLCSAFPPECGNVSELVIDAIYNTSVLASQCDKDILEPHDLIPRVSKNPRGDLKELCRAGWKKYLSGLMGTTDSGGHYYKKDKYVDRLKMEFGLIGQEAIANIFLIIHEIIQFADKEGIAVRARGSVAGSLIAFLLGITDINPIKYGLLFERFMNKARKGTANLPDIDLDIEYDRRDDIKNFLIDRWGVDNVSGISTFEYFKTRNALKDVARVFSVPFPLINSVTSEIPYDTELQDAVRVSPQLRKFIHDYPDVYKYAKMLCGQIRHMGGHAAGYVVCTDRISKYCPVLVRSKDSKDVFTQWDMDDIAAQGFLKFDLLGSKTMSAVAQVLSMIGKDWESIPLTDRATFREFLKGNTIGVFQFGRSYFKDLLRKLKPKNIDDLAIATALGRPGAKVTGQDLVYLGRQSNGITGDAYRQITKRTRGAVIFQEQIMELARIVSGMSLDDTNVLRKAIAKKKSYLMAQWKKNFQLGAKKKGYTQREINEFWNLIKAHAGYSFNKSHAVAYSYLSYVTMYLKVHYPYEFVAAMLSVYGTDKDKLIEYVKEGARLRLVMRPPHILLSDRGFRLVQSKRGKRIYQGFITITGIGEKTCDKILQLRKEHGRKIAEHLEPGIRTKLLKGGILGL